VAELHDEKLFEEPPPLEDCPICMIRLPFINSGKVYMACCGKVICRGCFHAVQSRATKRKEDICPFCRTPTPDSDEEVIKQYKERMKLNDANAIYNLGGFYKQGLIGLPQNTAKALELYHKAGELGSANAYYCLGCAYRLGEGVERDEEKNKHYWELAAIEGDVNARRNLGAYEGNAGNMDRALKHFMIAAKDGYLESLEDIKVLYSNGYATKDDYAKALRLYQAYLSEIKSDQRDEAAAFGEDHKYYESAI